jgi:hypothetical protein
VGSDLDRRVEDERTGTREIVKEEDLKEGDGVCLELRLSSAKVRSHVDTESNY